MINPLRILCLLGHHKWQWYTGWVEYRCKRCGKL